MVTLLGVHMGRQQKQLHLDSLAAWGSVVMHGCPSRLMKQGSAHHYKNKQGSSLGVRVRQLQVSEVGAGAEVHKVVCG